MKEQDVVVRLSFRRRNQWKIPLYHQTVPDGVPYSQCQDRLIQSTLALSDSLIANEIDSRTTELDHSNQPALN